ncbi:MAG: alpha/beta fold hydrolase [Chitinivibrionales bacterium]|nr:alpha/beta fold hydrolase [Chitinivibrionales bacterium]
MKQSLILLLMVSCMMFMSVSGCIVEKSVYSRPSAEVQSPPPEPFKELTLPLPSGITVTGWECTRAQVSDTSPAIVYFHGNAENLHTMHLSGQFALLSTLRAHYVAIDYPGYGRSTGKPSEKSLAQACTAVAQWMNKRYPQSPLILCGWSLGAAAAIGCAAENADIVDGLIVISGWTSLHDVASQFYPAWLVGLLLRDRYNSLETIQRTTCPVLVIHGGNDRLIPFAQGERLAESVPGCRFIQIRNRGHNDLLSDSNVWTAIGEFIRTVQSAGIKPNNTDTLPIVE